MEFAAFAARIDPGGQFAQQRFVERAAGESRIELGGVDAAQPRAQAAVDHPPRERRGVAAEQREQRRPAESRAQGFAVRLDVGEEQVAEGDAFDPGQRSRARSSAAEKLAS